MKSISWRVQLGIVAVGYATALVISAALLYVRHLQELKYPAEASGGMWAAGDAMLWIFIAGLFAIPSAFLIWVIAKFESIYKTYSQLLFGLSLSAPVCLGVVTLGNSYLAESVSSLCLYRLFWSPLILLGMGVSRLAARFDRAKRLISYALLVEGLTLAIGVALLIHAWGGPKNR
ncbi:MAG: hypothetical protein WAK91_12880 [Candidatus Acidiferrales bacterium]